MNRRSLLLGAFGCSGCLLSSWLHAQIDWTSPPRLARPDIGTDEGGLWALMDREETKLRRSPFTIRDRALRDYVQSIACKLAGAHCPDVRVHLVNTPLFNASMAPNGMMQVWSGLMLRVENEAQLAAILGHEIGHYVQRHTLERLRDAKSRSAFGQFLGLFGLVGAVGQLALLASMFAYSREQESEADRIGLVLMGQAGYDGREAARVWQNLLQEIKARKDSDFARTPMFATHPDPEERQQVLAKLAESQPGGSTGEESWEKVLAPHRHEWIMDEVKRRQYDESLALLNRLVERRTGQAEYLFARGEVFRMRSQDKDADAALADFRAAVAVGSEPAATHRSLGLVLRQRNEPAAARASFETYLKRAPDAPDAALIKTYLAELGT
jgi:predicted Zn-dependent protease